MAKVTKLIKGRAEIESRSTYLQSHTLNHFVDLSSWSVPQVVLRVVVPMARGFRLNCRQDYPSCWMNWWHRSRNLEPARGAARMDDPSSELPSRGWTCCLYINLWETSDRHHHKGSSLLLCRLVRPILVADCVLQSGLNKIFPPTCSFYNMTLMLLPSGKFSHLESGRDCDPQRDVMLCDF